MDKNHYCVIMAGGIGSRFWPLSRTQKPKQFLDILGIGKTLLQQTFDRFSGICPEENILVVTNVDYKNLVLEQLPGIRPSNILLEPMRKNTAPCIAYANYKINKMNPDACIVVAPSDHFILKEKQFKERITEGFRFARNRDALLTLGIKPDRIETGFGYIQISNEDIKETSSDLRKVKTFTEKPDYELARVFYESGEFLWNSGIFIWSLSSIMNAFDKHLSEVDGIFREGIKLYNTENESEFILKTYSKCRNISIDYGVMEKADNVYVLSSEFGWSDLSTWGSLYEKLEKDKNKNTITGANIFNYDVRGSILSVPENKLVVLQGLENYIVVDTDDILLVCRKGDEQKIKQFVNDIKLSEGDEYI